LVCARSLTRLFLENWQEQQAEKVKLSDGVRAERDQHGIVPDAERAYRETCLPASAPPAASQYFVGELTTQRDLILEVPFWHAVNAANFARLRRTDILSPRDGPLWNKNPIATRVALAFVLAGTCAAAQELWKAR
jgi:hypothetical protein